MPPTADATTESKSEPAAEPAAGSALTLGPRRVLGAGLAPMPYPGRRALLSSVLLACGWAIEVDGAERLAEVPDPAIFAFNHLSSYEAIAVPPAMILLRAGANVQAT
jgi:hypothetical protein